MMHRITTEHDALRLVPNDGPATLLGWDGQPWVLFPSLSAALDSLQRRRSRQQIEVDGAPAVLLSREEAA